MNDQLPKAYIPADAEQRWYEQWTASGQFASAPNEGTPPYSILMPPPNVTGILHFGHVLNMTLQDLYIRWHRLDGSEACWFPGADHAGIATQTKVEQELRKEGKTRHDLGRDAFVERVWDWKNRYGGIIESQLRTLGASCDWDRWLFTMDPTASSAVQEVFVRLFDEGLIYRGKRIINWSPLAQSALSDEEVIFKEVREQLYTMRYHLADGSGTLLVATVRPETIFADVAVAVNPKDERYVHLIGKDVIVPVSGQRVPIIADDYADPAFGTGCVKVTPAHDPNDFEIGERHGLPKPSCIEPDATLNAMAGEFAGLDRFVARKKVVKKLEELDLLEKSEDYTHNVGFSERGGEVVEPYLSDQWFVNMKPLAEPALKVVLDGSVKFYPEHWVKTYEHWMTGIRDWCISRQLWWGHRIPVYYTPDGRHTAARSLDEARTKLGVDASVELTQDPDVLDTWFSSWLWPMTTMGWDGSDASLRNPNMKYYTPTDLLVTGPDIIFFWVARMIMASLKFNGTIPFKDVYFTSIIRDSKGRKLSKSLGNSPDPLDVITKYGADAVRFTMVYLAPMGQDVRLDVDEKTQDIASMEIGRNFANKVWNAARFLDMKRGEISGENHGKTLTTDEMSTADVWITSRLASTLNDVTQALDSYRITEYAKTMYDFIWRDFCDWYVEIVKVQFVQAVDSDRRWKLMNHTFGVFEDILRMLHPIMPFLTEELWHSIYGTSAAQSIGRSGTLRGRGHEQRAAVEQQFETLQAVVESIRRQRNEMVIPPSERLPVVINVPAEMLSLFQEQQPVIASFGRASTLQIGTHEQKPAGSVADVVRGVDIYLVVEGKVDLAKERERLTKERDRLRGQITGIEKKLGNAGFMQGAKPEVVEAEQRKLADFSETIVKIERNLAALA